MTSAARAIVSVMGRFHGFDLARELDRRGRLARLFTSYPRSTLARFGLDAAQAATLPWVEVSGRALRKVAPARAAEMEPWFSARYDRWVATSLTGDAQAFIGWSGQCMASLRRANDLGLSTIVERGSAHIEAQRDLLVDEFARFDLAPALPHADTIARELAEYEYADYICVPSKFALRTFVERGVPREKLLVNPYGVELDAFSPAASDAPGFRVLFCGRASIQKGLPYLLQAFELFDGEGSELWIQGGVEPDAEGLRRSTTDSRVRWLGHRPQHELPLTYRSAHVLVLPSIQDGFGLVVAQAMACGVPCIVSQNTGGADLIRHGVDGFVVPIRDPGAIATHLEALHRDPQLRRAMGRAARERVAEGHSWADYGRRAVALVDHVVEAERPTRGPQPFHDTDLHDLREAI